MNKPDRPAPPSLLEWYHSERRYYDEGRRRAEQRIDQMISGGAAGALVLSITLVGVLPVAPGHGLLLLLGGSWLALMASLAVSLRSLYESAEAHLTVVRSLDEARAAGTLATYQAPKVKADKRTKGLNRSSVRLLGLGITGLAIFSVITLWQAGGP